MTPSVEYRDLTALARRTLRTLAMLSVALQRNPSHDEFAEAQYHSFAPARPVGLQLLLDHGLIERVGDGYALTDQGRGVYERRGPTANLRPRP